MADYWKSNAKKFCEICKVWFADNKISIENHERGLKHKGMVQQRIREMSKRADQKDASSVHLNATIVAMEQAALAAMKRDGRVASSVGRDPRGFSKPVEEKVDPKQEVKDRKRKIEELRKTVKRSTLWNPDEDDDLIEWVQAEANGQTYYWNIFAQGTTYEVPGLFYTTQEYTDNYAEICGKVNEILKKKSANGQSPDEEQPSRVPTKFEKETQSAIVSDQPGTSDSTVLTSIDTKDIGRDFKKKVSSQRDWDIRKLIASDVVETVQKPDNNDESTSKYVDRVVDQTPTSGLGPWIPIVEKAPCTTELQKRDHKKIVMDDLPEQDRGPKGDIKFDEDEHGAETNFTAKILPVDGSKKKSKPVFFRKPKSSKGASIKQEDD